MIAWEMYGNPNDVVYTSMNAEGDFVLSVNGLVANGRLVSHGQSSATVTLSSASFGGVSVCTPGTYTFAVE